MVAPAAPAADAPTVWSAAADWRPLYPFKSHYHERPAGRLHYIHEGAGHATRGTVLCVHGNPTWSFFWRDVIKALCDEFQIIAPDHLGCGLSDMPARPPYRYTLEERVADLSSLMESVAPTGPIHLVLHDWGGMIGTTFALGESVRPRIASITALNTACFLLPRGKAFPWMLRVLKSMPWLAEFLTLRCNLFAATAAATCTATPLDPAVRAGLLHPYRAPARRAATHWFVQDIPESPRDPAYALAARTDSEAPAAFAQVPIFLPWGLRDYVFDGDFLAEWRRRFPHAAAMPRPASGHYLLEDDGPAVIPAIVDHIRRAAR